MRNIKYLADLIIDYGSTFYGHETPEHVAAQWLEALPEANLSDFHEWFDRGFWDQDVARALSDAGIHPWEVPSDTSYDLCSGDLPVALFLQSRRH